MQQQKRPPWLSRKRLELLGSDFCNPTNASATQGNRYNATGQFTDIDRFKDLDGGSTHHVVETDFVYDNLGRLTDLTHTHDATTIADYGWTFDSYSRVTQMSFTSSTGNSGTSDYSYDDTGQVTAADHDFQTDESYSYDENGNRTLTGYTTGDNNQLTSDGTFNYTYDDEGNRLTRTRISGTADDYTTEYEWDHDNRLTKLTYKNNGGTVTKEIEYGYDLFGRRISKTIDWDGEEAAPPRKSTTFTMATTSCWPSMATET